MTFVTSCEVTTWPSQLTVGICFGPLEAQSMHMRHGPIPLTQDIGHTCIWAREWGSLTGLYYIIKELMHVIMSNFRNGHAALSDFRNAHVSSLCFLL